MKTRNNKRFLAFFVAISIMVGILCGNGNVRVTQAEDEKSGIEKLHEKHEEDGYKEAGSYTNSDLPVEAKYYSVEAKSDDISLILDAINTNYKYMEFKGSEIDEVAGYLNEMYDYFYSLINEKDEVVKYFGEKTLIYEPDSETIGKGTLKFSNEDDEEFEREITVKFEDTNVETGENIKATLSENENVIKRIEITKENICTITENNGIEYKLSVEAYKPENNQYTIKYSSIDDNKEWISLKKSGKTYSLEVTKAMDDKYGILLWYKDIEPTEAPTTEPTVTPTVSPTKQPDATASPSPEIQIKPSVTIAMGNTIKYEKLVKGKIKGEKIHVKIPKKYKKLLKASDKDKKITAKYTKKKLPENEIKVKVTVGAYTQDVMVKVIVAEPKNVKIKTELIKVNGKKYNKIKFFYKFNKKTSVKVKLKGKNKQFNTILNKYVKGNKGYKYNKNVYVTTPSRKKTVTFKILLRCGKNKSDWIEKKLKLK